MRDSHDQALWESAPSRQARRRMVYLQCPEDDGWHRWYPRKSTSPKSMAPCARRIQNIISSKPLKKIYKKLSIETWKSHFNWAIKNTPIIPSKPGSIIPYSNQLTRVFLMAQLTLTLQFSAWEPTAKALTAGGVDPPTDHRLKVALHVPGMDRTEHPKKIEWT